MMTLPPPMTKTILIYGVALAVLALSFSSICYFYFVRELPTELFILLLALLFTGLGLWAGRFLSRQRSTPSSGESVNDAAIEALGLTRRELEVLNLLAEGCSNQDIAARLFVSVNTIKSHVSSLLAKLDVHRRTQAVRKAQSLGLIASPERTH